MTKKSKANSRLSLSLRKLKRAFTLLEIMVSLGILAIGMSAAMGLFTAAAASGRRAEQAVQASMVADTVFSDIESRLTMSYNFSALEALTAEQSEELGLELPVAPEEGAPEGDSEDDGSGEMNGGNDSEEGGFDDGGEPPVDNSPRVFLAGEELPEFPGYKVWVILTPLPKQGENPIALFCEVHVQWSNKGRKRGQQYRTVLLRRLSKLDIPSLNGGGDD
ncbi:MAG: type II secretion system protein [Planctomycetota bacterium]|nr:type II secretion system protein [Planctomycetota bacterium]